MITIGSKLRHSVITVAALMLSVGTIDASANNEQRVAVKKYSVSIDQIRTAAERGDADAQYALGYMYYYGQQLPKDLVKAKTWIRRAANQGQKPAITALSLLGETPDATNASVAAASTDTPRTGGFSRTQVAKMHQSMVNSHADSASTLSRQQSHPANSQSFNSQRATNGKSATTSYNQPSATKVAVTSRRHAPSAAFSTATKPVNQANAKLADRPFSRIETKKIATRTESSHTNAKVESSVKVTEAPSGKVIARTTTATTTTVKPANHNGSKQIARSHIAQKQASSSKPVAKSQPHRFTLAKARAAKATTSQRSAASKHRVASAMSPRHKVAIKADRAAEKPNLGASIVRQKASIIPSQPQRLTHQVAIHRNNANIERYRKKYEHVASVKRELSTGSSQSGLQQTASNKALHAKHKTAKAVTSKPSKVMANADTASPAHHLTRTERHLLKRGNDHYTLQLLGGHNLAQVKAVLKANHLQKHAAIYHTYYQDKDWYVLVYGDFANPEDALAAIDRLPERAQQLKPWVKPMASVKLSIRAAKPIA